MGLWSSGDVVPSTSPSSRASPPIYFESLRCYSGVSSATLRHSSWRPCRGLSTTIGASVRTLQGQCHGAFGASVYRQSGIPSVAPSPSRGWLGDYHLHILEHHPTSCLRPVVFSIFPSSALHADPGLHHSPNRGLSVQHQVFIGIPSGASRGALHLRQLMVRGFQCGVQSSPVAHQGPSIWHSVLLRYLFRALSRAPCLPHGLLEAFSFHF